MNLAVAMLTVTREDPQGFGRIVRDENGEIVAIVEEADCTPEQLAIRELNPGVYCFDAAWLWDNLSKLRSAPRVSTISRTWWDWAWNRASVSSHWTPLPMI